MMEISKEKILLRLVYSSIVQFIKLLIKSKLLLTQCLLCFAFMTQFLKEIRMIFKFIAQNFHSRFGFMGSKLQIKSGIIW